MMSGRRTRRRRPNESEEEEHKMMNNNYFLRHFPNPFESTAFGRVEDEQGMFEGIRAQFGDALVAGSMRRFGREAMLVEGEEEEMMMMEEDGRKDGRGRMEEDGRKDGRRGGGGEERRRQKAEECPNWMNGRGGRGEEEEEGMAERVMNSLDLAAAPSPFGANALAQAIVYGLTGKHGTKMDGVDIEGAEQFAQMDYCGTTAVQSAAKEEGGAGSHQLVTLGLDCVFSVLLELNRRDPELCAQSLQSLLQLLQNMEPESLGGQSARMTARMHELLRQLRRDGNANVSAGANACMMSLAVASGQPEFLFATVAALMCEPKRHLPHNQISADSNPLPHNVQVLAQSAQMLIVGDGTNGTVASAATWLALPPLEQRPLVCEFDVIYTGSGALLGDGGGHKSASAGVQGCLVSDGAYIYLLTQFGLLKMGTGLSETRAGEVLTCNELLKFADGSALFVSNESLYLRRRHSPRLWVLDTDNLREIGEIMLPSALSTSGVLLADGRQFWHAQLDEQWHLRCAPLDDSFGPQQQQEQVPAACPEGGGQWRGGMSGAGSIRLMDTEFCAFGEMDESQRRLLHAIPPKLRGIVADLQLGPGIGFLLSRCGKIFYAGPGIQSAFDLAPSKSDGPFGWVRLQVPEPIVQMALEQANRTTLFLRSGAGNLWMVGGGGGHQQANRGKSPKRRRSGGAAGGEGGGGWIRKLKVPNKRKCTSLSVVAVGGGCLAYATENGRCFLLGRHVLNSGGGGGGQLPSVAAILSSPAKQTPFPVAGLANVPVAQVALGKTHLVAIGKNGAVYATGLNNQNQCGRAATMPTTTITMPPSSSAQPMPPPPSASSAAPTNAASSSHHSAASITSMASSSSSSQHQFCSQHGQHFFLDDAASVCALCGQCSVQGAACPAASAQQAKGAFCPCARAGPSCCLRCGLCKNCAETERRRRRGGENGRRGGMENGFGAMEKQQQQTRLALSPKAVRLQLSSKREMLGIGQQLAPLAKDEELLVVEEEAERGEESRRKKREEEDGGGGMGGGGSGTPGTTRIFGPERIVLQQQPTIKVAAVSVGNFHTVVLSADNQVYTFGANTHGQLGTGDTLARAGAHKLALPANVQVVQAVAGASHTVLRTLDGRLVTFGAHKAGQLGRKRLAVPAEADGAHSPQSTRPPAPQWFAEPGFVPGFGQAYGRLASWVGAQGDRTLVQVQRQLFSRAELAEGRISANGECLLVVPGGQNSSSQGRPLSMAIVNNNKGYLMIRRGAEGGGRGGGGHLTTSFRHFQWNNTSGGMPADGVTDLAKCSFCLDPRHFNLIWAYDPQRMCVFALSNCAPSSTPSSSSPLPPPFLRRHHQFLLRSTELMVPSPSSPAAFDHAIVDEDADNGDDDGGDGSLGSTDSTIPPIRYSDCQLGLFLLSTIHSLCLEAIVGTFAENAENGEEEEEREEEATAASMMGGGGWREGADGRECRMVNRFDNFGGGWGYSAHCVEAIQFKSTRDILFCGVGLFGGRGEYTARLKLFRVLEQQKEEEADAIPAAVPQQCVELLAETDEVLYECAPRETAVLQLERPIRVGRHRWHVIWVQITGPSSDCGAGGQPVVRAEVGADSEEEEAVEFHFRPNALSNNGTNVEVGQIPELYFLTPPDGPQSEEDEADGQPSQFLQKHGAMAAVRGALKSGANAGKRRSKARHRLISPRALFRIGPKSLDQLLRIAEWALEGGGGGAFLEAGQADELLDCDWAWRQERAALIAILAFRLLRLYLLRLLPPHQNSGASAEGAAHVLAFHRLLRHILEKKVQEEDQVGTFLLAEAVSTYAICAHLFIPCAELLKTRLAEQIGGSAQKNWWLLALLCSLERLDEQMLLPILGFSEGQKEEDGKRRGGKKGGKKRKNWMEELADAFLRAEKGDENENQRPSAQAILRFLFDLAFAEGEEDGGGDEAEDMARSESRRNNQENALLPRLNSSAQRILCALADQLVSRCAPALSDGPSSVTHPPPPLQTPSRFHQISPHPQWDVGTGGGGAVDCCWDAIGLRVDSTTTTILLRGVGLFSGIGPGQGPHSFELELLQSEANPEDWRPLDRTHGPLDSFPTQSVLFTRPWPLLPELNYVLRVRFEGVGKTLYGEGGLASVQLTDKSQLHFVPCAMSRNGTNVARGQFPFLLYSMATMDGPQKGGGQQEDAEKKEGKREMVAAIVQFFLQFLRLLVQRLGQRMVHRTDREGDEQRLFQPGEQALCATLMGRTNLLLEYRKELAFDVATVLDEAIPILAHVNSALGQVENGEEEREQEEDEMDQRSPSCSSADEMAKCSGKMMAKSVGMPPIWLESPHPYRPGQLHIQRLAIASAQSLAVRFDPQCRTARPGDSLWVYVAKEGAGLVPIGRFSERNWPTGNLVVPGGKLCLLFEAGQRGEGEPENNFGFRCSIEPIPAHPFAHLPPNHSLERHFVWCLANSARQLLQIGGQGEKAEETKVAAREVLARYPLLARRGIRYGGQGGGSVVPPALGELLDNGWWRNGGKKEGGEREEEEKGKEAQFFAQFAHGHPAHSPAAILASALCLHHSSPSFLHLAHSQLRLMPPDQIRAGKPVSIQLIARDQHNREVAVAEDGIQIEVVLMSGAQGATLDASGTKLAASATKLDWAGLKAEQMHKANQFRPVLVGRALYQCISMMPSLAGHSLEELRFSFAFGQPSKERIRLSRATNEGGAAIFTANWTPRCAATFSLQCFIDGRPLLSQMPRLEVREVADAVVPVASSISSPPPLRSVHDLANQQRATNVVVRSAATTTSPMRRAHFPAVSPYLAIRIRAHPSLSAAQIGQVPRGCWLDFTEVLRNNDGIWLRLGEASRKEFLEAGKEQMAMEMEAWVLQMNGHLQTELLQMAPPSNGNFIPSAESGAGGKLQIQTGAQQPQIATISILDSPKFRPKPASPSIAAAISPRSSVAADVHHNSPALGPALLEAFRWTFCASVWHSSPGDGLATVGDLMEAGNWLKARSPTLIETLWEKEKSGGTELPGHLAKALASWREMSSQVWRKIRQEKEKAERREEAGESGTALAERLQRNAQFLLELNRDERADQGKEESKPAVLSIDPYPEAGPKLLLQNANIADADMEEWRQKRRADGKWHTSDPGQPRSEGIRPHHPAPPCSASAAPNLVGGADSGGRKIGGGAELATAIADFVFAETDLATLRSLFRQSLLRAVSLSFAFRLWHWLIKLATVEQSSYDVIWHFLSALHQFSPSTNSPPPKLLPHPAQLCLLAGHRPIAQMVHQFHSLLQQLALILQQSPPPPNGDGGDGHRLRCLCFRAWTFQLTGHEQAILPTIRSLLGAVRNILACSSAADTTGTAASNNTNNSAESTVAAGSIPKSASNGGGGGTGQCQVHLMEDMTAGAKLEASSRAQLLACLLDGSCETFWESGDDDRGKGKQRKLILSWRGKTAKLGAIYVDNGRDQGFRVERLLVRGSREDEEEDEEGDEERAPTKIMLDAKLEKDFCGWLKFAVESHLHRVEIAIWGDELGCRVRQLRLFGLAEGGGNGHQKCHQQQSASATSSIRPSNSQLFGGGGAQGDAFALFQSLATQVFADEFSSADGNGILREQVLDLLFSRSQLQPIQSFVGTHVSNAVEREVANLRSKRKRHFSYVAALVQMLARISGSTAAAPSDPSSSIASATPQFTSDAHLLVVLSQLWLFGPESIQQQALEAVGKLLGQCRPEMAEEAAVKLLVENLLVLVAKAISVQIKERRQRGGGGGGGRNLEKHSIATHLAAPPADWCIPEQPSASVHIAQLAIRLLRQLPAEWRAPLRTDVGAHVMRFSATLRDSATKGHCPPLSAAIRSPQFWLCLAALGAMDGPEWVEAAPGYQQLKADQSRANVPLCENHDDGRTRAQLHCQTCALSLCRECFAVLHLSRRAQSHPARLVGAALAPLPRADFHEGCHRLRIGPQLLVLLNPKNLAGLVELDDGADGAMAVGGGPGRSPPSSMPSSSSASSSMSSTTFRKSSSSLKQKGTKMASAQGGGRKGEADNGNGEDAEWMMEEGREEEEESDGQEEEEANQRMQESALMEAKCRFCGAQLASEQLFNGVCNFSECRQKQADACPNTIQQCGHWCPGIRDEPQCPPCLQCPSTGNRQDADDLCAICLSERLGESPCLLLPRCQHIFHWRCLRTALEKRWPGPRISFRFMQCPLCKAQIEHPALADLLIPLRTLEKDVAQKARLRLEYEGHGGRHLEEAAAASSSAMVEQSGMLEMALAKYMYVQCSRCTKAYFGGDARCQQQLEETGAADKAFDPAELVCGRCAAEQSGGSGTWAGVCGRHGADFLEFKCRFCCSVAMYFCFGSTHFCAGCHGDFPRLVALPKQSLPKCPAGPLGQQLPDAEPCPLGLAAATHPAAGEEFALGCGICRNLDTF